jgi:hypothetical protein
MAERVTLESWKIGACLHRSIKTCRRLQRELGLPVHRLEDSPKARVLGYPEELEEWIKKIQTSDAPRSKAELFLRKWWPPAAVVAAGALILLGVFKILGPGTHEAPLDSIAILPIVNESGDPAQDDFADTLTELLISELYKIKALSVVPRTGVLPYRKTENLGRTLPLSSASRLGSQPRSSNSVAESA